MADDEGSAKSAVHAAPLVGINGGVAQSVNALNSNRKIVCSMTTLGITRCCVLGKTINANISTSSSAVQWIKAQIGNCNVVDSRFGSKTGQCMIVSLEKTLIANFPILGPSNLPVVVPNLTKLRVGVIDNRSLLVWLTNTKYIRFGTYEERYPDNFPN